MSNYNSNILIENINKLLASNQMTQTQLGDILGMSQPNISKALNKNDKKSFTLDQVAGIAKYFNVSIDFLLGNAEPSEIRVTPKTTAAFLSELISQHDAKLTFIKKNEEIYTPCWDFKDNFPSYNVELKEITYPAIYLPSYWEVPKSISEGISEEDLMGVQAEAEQCGNDTRMLEVNKFLFHFKEIFEIYEKNGLTSETYEAVLTDMLNRLKD